MTFIPLPAFPTCPVVSTFAVADENPISEGGKWGYPIRGSNPNTNTMRIVGNKLATNTSGVNTGEVYWAVQQFWNVDTYITIDTMPTTDGAYTVLFARVAEVATTGIDSYSVEWTYKAAATDIWTLAKYTNAAYTQIYTFANRDVVAGEKIGLRIYGTDPVICQAYVCSTGGVWSQVGSDYADAAAGRFVQPGVGALNLAFPNSPERISEYAIGEIPWPNNGYLNRTLSRLKHPKPIFTPRVGAAWPM